MIVADKTYTKNCARCQAAPFCLPVGLRQDELPQLDNIVKKRQCLARGEHVYHRGDAFKQFYAVQRGTLKSYVDSIDGREQVHGFYFVGEFMGLDGVATEAYPTAMVALEDSVVCEIPYERLLSVAATMPNLQRQIFHLMGEHVSLHSQLVANTTAEERLVLFLLNVSNRFKQRGLSAKSFRLPMTRQDIANYLGLAVETVSRLFTRLQAAGILITKGKQVEVCDLAQLQSLVH